MRKWTSVLTFVLFVFVPTALDTFLLGYFSEFFSSAFWQSALLISTTIVVATIMILAQRFLLPTFSDSWKDYGQDVPTDLMHAIVSTLLGKEMGEHLPILILAPLLLVSEIPTLHMFVELPLLVQFVIALIVGDFGAYWMHRLLHKDSNPSQGRITQWCYAHIWPFHATHHEPVRLNILSSAHTHPINSAVIWICQSVPIIMLGVSDSTMLSLAIYTSMNGLLQHSNIDLDLGGLEKIFAVTDVHRVHHSRDPEYFQSNFGSNLVIFDRMFGSYKMPEDGPSDLVGVPALIGMRKRSPVIAFLRDLAMPFIYGWLTRRIAEERAEE